MNNEFVMVPRGLTDDMAELIVEKARVCGGGAFEIWEAICERFGKPVDDHKDIAIQALNGLIQAREDLVQPAAQNKDDAIGSLSRDANETIVFTPNGDPHIKDGMPVFAEPAHQGEAVPLTEWQELVSERDTLRAQLASSQRACNMMLEAYDDGVQPGCAQPAIKAALAASAEPSAPKSIDLDDDPYFTQQVEAHNKKPRAPAERDERSAFDAYCKKVGLPVDLLPTGEYLIPATRFVSQGWHAHAALERKPAELKQCAQGYGHGGHWCGPEYKCWLDPRSKEEIAEANKGRKP